MSEIELEPVVEECMKELSSLTDVNGLPITDYDTEGYIYVYAVRGDRISIEWYSTLAQKTLLWKPDGNGGWIEVNAADMKNNFSHFLFSYTNPNVMNGNTLEKLLHEELEDHPHKLWEGNGKGRMGGSVAVGLPGDYRVGVTYVKELPKNWRVSKEKPVI